MPDQPDVPKRWARTRASQGITVTARPDAIRNAMAKATDTTTSRRWTGHGMTRQALADHAGCSLGLIGKILAGPFPITLELADAIAEALHAPTHELFDDGASTNEASDRTDSGQG
jgi:transcriptional regulator with XRE-family HTH domain